MTLERSDKAQAADLILFFLSVVGCKMLAHFQAVAQIVILSTWSRVTSSAWPAVAPGEEPLDGAVIKRRRP